MAAIPAVALTLLGSAPTIISGISSLIHGFENIFGHGNGAAKKAAVVSAFEGGAQAYNAAVTAVTGVDPKVKLPQFSADAEKAFSSLVDAIVAFYNASGIFEHSAAK